MLKNAFLDASWKHFAALGTEMLQNWILEVLGPLWGLGTEMHRNAQKCTKIVFWKFPGPTWVPKRTNCCFLESSWAHFAGWAPKCSKTVLTDFWARFVGWAMKCSKTALWRLPRQIFRAGSRNALQIFWMLRGLGSEMPQNGFVEVSGAHFAGWAPKCSKQNYGGFLGPCSGLGHCEASQRVLLPL